MGMRGKEGVMRNAAEEKSPRRQTSAKPGAPSRGSDVGNEIKAAVRAVQEGGSMAEASGNPLKHATAELHSQHPHPYTDHGPHHGTTDHVRHQPLHGMTPSNGYGR